MASWIPLSKQCLRRLYVTSLLLPSMAGAQWVVPLRPLAGPRRDKNVPPTVPQPRRLCHRHADVGKGALAAPRQGGGKDVGADSQSARDGPNKIGPLQKARRHPHLNPPPSRGRRGVRAMTSIAPTRPPQGAAARQASFANPALRSATQGEAAGFGAQGVSRPPYLTLTQPCPRKGRGAEEADPLPVGRAGFAEWTLSDDAAGTGTLHFVQSDKRRAQDDRGGRPPPSRGRKHVGADCQWLGPDFVGTAMAAFRPSHRPAAGPMRLGPYRTAGEADPSRCSG